MHALLIPLALVAVIIVASIAFAAGAWWSTRRRDDWQSSYPYISDDHAGRIREKLARQSEFRTLTADDIMRQVGAL